MHKLVKDRHIPQQLTDLLRKYKTTLTLMSLSITKIFQLHSFCSLLTEESSS
jgi:hypothetical protein